MCVFLYCVLQRTKKYIWTRLRLILNSKNVMTSWDDIRICKLAFTLYCTVYSYIYICAIARYSLYPESLSLSAKKFRGSSITLPPRDSIDLRTRISISSEKDVPLLWIFKRSPLFFVPLPGSRNHAVNTCTNDRLGAGGAESMQVPCTTCAGKYLLQYTCGATQGLVHKRPAMYCIYSLLAVSL